MESKLNGGSTELKLKGSTNKTELTKERPEESWGDESS